jgi:cytochrome c
MRLVLILIALVSTSIMTLLAVAAPSSMPDSRKLVEQSCGSCHTLRKEQGSSEGPNLFGVVGREAGMIAGYKYSPAFLEALRGRSWTPQLLDEWLADSQAVAPGSGMILLIENANERRAIISYLSQNS